MLKREWGAESNGKLPHLFILSKTATLVLQFAVEDLPLGRAAALVPEFAVKGLPWAEQSDDFSVFFVLIYIVYVLFSKLSHGLVSQTYLLANKNSTYTTGIINYYYIIGTTINFSFILFSSSVLRRCLYVRYRVSI